MSFCQYCIAVVRSRECLSVGKPIIWQPGSEIRKNGKAPESDAQNISQRQTQHSSEFQESSQIEKSTHKSFSLRRCVYKCTYLQPDAAYFEFPGTLPFIGVYFIIRQRARSARDEFMRYLACAPARAFPKGIGALCAQNAFALPHLSFLSRAGPCMCVCAELGVLCLQENKMPPRQTLHTKMRRRGPFSFSLSLDDALPAMGIEGGVHAWE